MTSVPFILLKSKIFPVRKKHVQVWSKKGDLDKIHWALKHGNYSVRGIAARSVERIGCHTSIPHLIEAINEKVYVVAIHILNALESIDIELNHTSLIYKKRFKWAKIKYKMNQKRHTKRKYNIYRWERTSKKNFELVKERLKRPIR